MIQNARISMRWMGAVMLLASTLFFVSEKTAIAGYVTTSQIDVTKFIAPPPAPDSSEQQQDLDAVLKAQADRTTAEIQRANETEQLSVFGFSDVVDDFFNEDSLPATAALFQQLFDDTLILLKVGKDKWNRPRPFLINDQVKPFGELPKSSGYPSGNSWLGHLFAIILADLIPEKSAIIFARGKESGDNRIIAGVHYPTDITAGRQAAAAMAAVLYATPGFHEDLDKVRAELKDAGFINDQDYKNK